MWFSDDSVEAQAYSQVSGGGHTPKLSHELVAAAASYEAARAYQDHVRRQGRPVSHEKSMQLLAAFTGAYVDRIVETKGLDTFDRARLKHDAHERAKAGLARYNQSQI